MARSALRDPLDKFRWTVDIPGFSRLGFAQFGTPKYTITTKEYAEGGAHLNPKSIIEKVSYAPLTLTRGVTNDTSFSKWAFAAADLVQNNAALKNGSPSIFKDPVGAVTDVAFNGGGAKSVASSDTYPFTYRKDVRISHVNRAGQTEVMYILYNAYVISYQPASDFDASSDDGVSIETLVLGYEGMDVKYTGIAGLVGNTISGINSGGGFLGS